MGLVYREVLVEVIREVSKEFGTISVNRNDQIDIAVCPGTKVIESLIEHLEGVCGLRADILVLQCPDDVVEGLYSQGLDLDLVGLVRLQPIHIEEGEGECEGDDDTGEENVEPEPEAL